MKGNAACRFLRNFTSQAIFGSIMKNHLLISLSVIIATVVSAQNPHTEGITSFGQKKDSLLRELQRYPAANGQRIAVLHQLLVQAVYLEEKKQVLPFWAEALRLSKTLYDKGNEAYCLVWRGSYYKSTLRYDSAMHFIDSGLQTVPQPVTATEKNARAFGLYLKGMICEQQDNYYNAINAYFGALHYANEKGTMRPQLYSHIAGVYAKMGNREKALQYAKSVLTVTGDTSTFNPEECGSYMMIADLYMSGQDLHNAARYLNLARPFIPILSQPSVTASYYRLCGNILAYEKKYEQACDAYQQALRFFGITHTRHPGNTATVLNEMAKAKQAAGQTAAAIRYALQSVAAAKAGKNKISQTNALITLANCYQQEARYADACLALQQARQLNDSIHTESVIRQTHTLAAIYENDQKEKAITQLQHDKKLQENKMRQQSLLNILFVIALAALLITGWLLYRYYKDKQKIQGQRQQIQQQRISRLEKEKQFLATDAMLKGQEEERSRLAKDLHDGLGGFLSGLKFSFANLKQQSSPAAPYAALIDQSISQLDYTILELRKVSHNLMPEALVKFGLRSAVKDFCEAMELASGIRIICQFLGSERKIGQMTAVNIYRIIQELVNNAIRHGRPGQVLLQLTFTPIKLLITAEDNGKGFDIRALDKASGIGFANIRRRVDYFNGTLEIHSAPGEGSIINIELLV
jgi:two-component system, NarL family, sensor kinase